MESHPFVLKGKRRTRRAMGNCVADVLHSIRSLLCTSTNVTSHERLFSFARRSASGRSLPSWLITLGPVLLQRHVRISKSDPLYDEVELTEANPTYAYVKFPDGRETTVSLQDLAPCPERPVSASDLACSVLPTPPASHGGEQPVPELPPTDLSSPPSFSTDNSDEPEAETLPRRSTRV